MCAHDARIIRGYNQGPITRYTSTRNSKAYIYAVYTALYTALCIHCIIHIYTVYTI